jgi:hypothetical protein
MNRTVRRKLEMAVRVRDFSRAHPSADANYAPVLARLEDRITRMETLAKQQAGGYLAKRSSVVRRKALRRRLHHELLRHLVKVAEVAALENEELQERFRLPKGNEPHEAFRTLARKMLEQAEPVREVLTKHGLADKLMDDLRVSVDQFDASVAETNEGKRDHVGAVAELKAVSDEVTRLVELLDGLNRYRFGRDAEMLAAWESARRVVSGPRAEPTPDGSSVGGEVKPAA